MAAWTAPATWTAAATVTHTQMNTEIRDHCIWLKAALDLITDSTAADSGTATYLRSVRSLSQHAYFVGNVTGDTDYRVWLGGGVDVATTAKPGLNLGSGAAAGDTNLYREAASTLMTDDGLIAAGGLATLTKAGVPSDTDVVAGMQVSGLMILDTTNSRIYFRVGSTYKYAALT